MVVCQKIIFELNTQYMESEDIIYTDGKHVTITESALEVKNSIYSLISIRKHGLSVLRGAKFPGIALAVLGTAMVVLALFNAMPFGLNVYENDSYVGPNTIALWIGGAMAAIGILIVLMARERYAIKIETPEGEENVVVSERKEYIVQILNALNEAFRRTGKNTWGRRHLSGMTLFK